MDWEAKQLWIGNKGDFATKNRRGRHVPLSDELLEMLKAWIVGGVPTSVFRHLVCQMPKRKPGCVAWKFILRNPGELKSLAQGTICATLSATSDTWRIPNESRCLSTNSFALFAMRTDVRTL
jgi:hypothetical protein